MRLKRSATRNQHWASYAERLNEAYGLVLLLVVVTYAAGSLTRFSGWSAVLLSALVGATSAVAFGSSGVRPARVRAVALAAGGGTVLAAVTALGGPEGFLSTTVAIQIFLLLAATVVILREVISSTAVSFRTILGAVSVYMIFGLLFSSLYVMIDRLQDGAFFAEGGTGTGDFLFFSFTTLTTTGYGDLVPAGQPGRMIAGMEMLLGQIFLVTLIAGLVSLWRPHSRTR